LTLNKGGSSVNHKSHNDPKLLEFLEAGNAPLHRTSSSLSSSASTSSFRRSQSS
jgi:hypothetical protein